MVCSHKETGHVSVEGFCFWVNVGLFQLNRVSRYVFSLFPPELQKQFYGNLKQTPKQIIQLVNMLSTAGVIIILM